ncbi:hypothetical protein MRB53_024070 [Persea americana]|uniref:Uncharacterized protein n=1 Tax=Persea americana TaxID=3435 RepID=A0ACC2LB56_PERAE|nr:hypothetical protein MRB53_024070 [Persea americana]
MKVEFDLVMDKKAMLLENDSDEGGEGQGSGSDRTERRSTPAGTSALGPTVRQRCENGEVCLAAGRRTDLLRQAPWLSLRQSVRNVKTNCLTPRGSSAHALAVLR